MSNYCQLIRRTRERGAKWSFVAHGATYSREEALEMKGRIESRGDEARLLPIKGAR
jgi:hypothetical protein